MDEEELQRRLKEKVALPAWAARAAEESDRKKRPESGASATSAASGAAAADTRPRSPRSRMVGAAEKAASAAGHKKGDRSSVLMFLMQAVARLVLVNATEMRQAMGILVLT